MTLTHTCWSTVKLPLRWPEGTHRDQSLEDQIDPIARNSVAFDALIDREARTMGAAPGIRWEDVAHAPGLDVPGLYVWYCLYCGALLYVGRAEKQTLRSRLGGRYTGGGKYAQLRLADDIRCGRPLPQTVLDLKRYRLRHRHAVAFAQHTEVRVRVLPVRNRAEVPGFEADAIIEFGRWNLAQGYEPLLNNDAPGRSRTRARKEMRGGRSAT